MRLMQPFLRLVKSDARLTQAAESMLALDLDARVPVRVVEQVVSVAEAITGDVDLGLKAALRVDMGDHDVLEYAAGSAATYGEALDVMLRYVRLLNEAADYSMQVQGDEAVLKLASQENLGRASQDFQCGAIVVACRHWLGSVPTGDILLPYPRPASIVQHEAVFQSARLCFDAPFLGFRFAARLLDTKLASADPKLHGVLKRQAEQMLAALPQAASFSEQVQKLVIEQLASGSLKGDVVAEKLSMSRRTLLRRLEQEGTTYKALLESARRRVAEHHLLRTDLTIHELAFLLGYSETAAFSRAFKRWTKLSPAEFRERAQSGQLAWEKPP